MPRQARKVSRSGIYHVILRGVNKQRIFEKPSDFEAMRRIIKYVQTTDTKKNPLPTPGFFLYAYCIMDNHVHMLIQPNNQEPGKIMTRIMTAYALYFNNEYERVGHLFQDRYKSEVVEDKDYFFTLLDYIHQNPVEAKICSEANQYRHSSLQEYLHMSTGGVSLCVFPENNLLSITLQQIQEYLGGQTEKTSMFSLIDRLKRLTRESNNELCQSIRQKLNWMTAEERDEAIVRMLLEMTDTKTVSEFQRLDKKTMRTALAIVRDSGVQKARLSRLTGIPIGVIRYAKVKFEE